MKNSCTDARAGDCFAGLIWPRLLRAGALALRPSRLGIALVMLVLIGVIGSVPRLWLGADDGEGPARVAEAGGAAAAGEVMQGVMTLNPAGVLRGLGQLAFGVPGEVVSTYPWSLAIVLVPLMLVWGVGGGAIARSAAVEYAYNERIPWPRALGFAVSKWASLLACKLAPIVAGLVVVGVMAVAGWVLLRWPGVQVAGGAAYVLALFAGLGLVLLAIGYALGGSMLIPAVACEGTDAIDAIQRAYAYPFSRPVRLVLYLLVLVVELALLGVVLMAIAGAVSGVSAWAVSILLPRDLADLMAAAATGSHGVAADSGWSRSTLAALVAFWSRIPGLLVAAFVVSFYFSGGTLLYLMMRLACDGQDPAEVWKPGQMPGVVPATEVPAPASDADDM